MPDEALVESAGGVLTVTMNRPEARDAVNHPAADGIARAIGRLATGAAGSEGR